MFSALPLSAQTLSLLRAFHMGDQAEKRVVPLGANSIKMHLLESGAMCIILCHNPVVHLLEK